MRRETKETKKKKKDKKTKKRKKKKKIEEKLIKKTNKKEKQKKKKKKIVQNEAKFSNRDSISKIYLPGRLFENRLIYSENLRVGHSQLGLDVTSTVVLKYFVMNATSLQYISHLKLILCIFTLFCMKYIALK